MMIHAQSRRQGRLPNLIVAGTTKSGTTSLYSWLSAHPQVATSRVKETGYFLAVRYDEPVPPMETYRAHFAHCGDESIVMESTPGYYYGGRAVAEAIAGRVGPNTRIVLLFREPVSRAVSHFKFKKSRLLLEDEITLDEYIDRCLSLPVPEGDTRENNPYWGLAGGCYSRHLDGWVDVFGDRLKILFFEPLRNEPRALLEELASWLGIEPGFFETADLTVENKTVGYKSGLLQRLALLANKRAEPFWRANPRVKRTLRRAYYSLNGRQFDDVSRESLERLQDYYRPWNRELLGKLEAIGVDRLPSWLSGAAASSGGRP